MTTVVIVLVVGISNLLLFFQSSLFQAHYIAILSIDSNLTTIYSSTNRVGISTVQFWMFFEISTPTRKTCLLYTSDAADETYPV